MNSNASSIERRIESRVCMRNLHHFDATQVKKVSHEVYPIFVRTVGPAFVSGWTYEYSVFNAPHNDLASRVDRNQFS